MNVADLMVHAMTAVMLGFALWFAWRVATAPERLVRRQNAVMAVADALFFERSEAHEWVRRQGNEFLVLKSADDGQCSLRLRLNGVGLTLIPTAHVVPASREGDSLGDPDFDARWSIRVMKGISITSLHPAARAALANAPASIGLMGGWLTWTGPSDPIEAHRALDLLHRLQELLEQRPPIEAFIVSEPIAAVRARAMEMLMAHDEDAAYRLAHRHLDDPSPEVEARMALCGTDDARKLAVLPQLDDAALAGRVVGSLHRSSTLKGVAILADRGRADFDGAAMLAMTRHDGAEAMALARVLGPRLVAHAETQERTFATVLHIASRLLDHAPDPDLELLPFWLGVLEHGSTAAKHTALRVLGSQAGADVVPVLRDMQQRLGWLQTGLRQQSDLAVRQIQSRVTGGHGGLALAPSTEAGMVSIADPIAAGALSEVDSPADRPRPPRRTQPQ